MATKLTLTEWLLAMHLLIRAKSNMAILGLSRHLRASCPPAWRMKHKLVDARRLLEDFRQITSRVELNDGHRARAGAPRLAEVRRTSGLSSRPCRRECSRNLGLVKQ